MAGGKGSRMLSSEKKQFIELEGRYVIAHTISKFWRHSDIDQIIVVSPQEDIEKMKNICQQEFDNYKITIVSGGKKRQNSVINGLRSCPPETEYVLIHDGVRPFVTDNMISELIKLVKLHDAVIPCSPVRYTLKQIKSNQIIKTVDRKHLYNAQTPQVFDFKLIYKFHKKALKTSIDFTDDSSILEYYGIPVYSLVCDDKNIKITDPYDLELARLLIRND